MRAETNSARARPAVATESRGFMRDRRGRFARIDVSGAMVTTPTGINNVGELTTIDVRGAMVTLVLDIDDHGQTAGIYVDPSGKVRGYSRERSGEVTTIDAPGAIQTRVCGINHRGQIVIDTVDAQLVHHGFLFDQGRFNEIKPRGAARNGSLATDVDDRGRVLDYVL